MSSLPLRCRNCRSCPRCRKRRHCRPTRSSLRWNCRHRRRASAQRVQGRSSCPFTYASPMPTLTRCISRTVFPKCVLDVPAPGTDCVMWHNSRVAVRHAGSARHARRAAQARPPDNDEKPCACLTRGELRTPSLIPEMRGDNGLRQQPLGPFTKFSNSGMSWQTPASHCDPCSQLGPAS